MPKNSTLTPAPRAKIVLRMWRARCDSRAGKDSRASAVESPRRYPRRWPRRFEPWRANTRGGATSASRSSLGAGGLGSRTSRSTG
jgi:hypothetical protein